MKFRFTHNEKKVPLDLPATKAAYEKWFEENRIDYDSLYLDWEDNPGEAFEIADLFSNETIYPNELNCINYFAALIEDAEETDVIKALKACNFNPVEAVYNSDCFELVEGVEDYEQLGRKVYEQELDGSRSFWDELIEEAKEDGEEFDFSSIGRSFAGVDDDFTPYSKAEKALSEKCHAPNPEHGCFCGYGFLRAYDGFVDWEHIVVPDKYEIAE